MTDWAARGMSMLPGLAPRPQCQIVDKSDLNETINSANNATFVYLRNVQTGKINVLGKVGKVTLEKCNGIEMMFSDRVVGGVLELIRCENIKLTLQENAEIPTIQVDDSKNVSFHIVQKSQIECVYFIRTVNLKLLLENQTVENESGLTLQYDIPTPDDSLQTQLVAHWSSTSPDANFISEVVVREGNYPTTAQMKKAAIEREEVALLKMADMLAQGITIRKPDSTPPDETDINYDPSQPFAVTKPRPNDGNPTPIGTFGRGTEDEKKEYFDDPETLSSKLDRLAEWIRSSQHCIFFTGAGISTSTGIPDFRSGMNTVLDTGPGAWELRDRNVKRDKKKKVKQVLKAVPSLTHMSIVKLQERDFIKFVVSQNVDGLHLRSGLDPSKLAELHGNTNLETCKRCKKKYLRDFRTRNATHVKDHETGRLCSDSKCRGKLVDSIVNFGESLPELDINKAFHHADTADLCIAIGSSLTVSPANDIPKQVAKRKKKLVICNLQKTPIHCDASMVIHAMCDDIMKGVMERLKLPLEAWKLKRRIRIAFEPTSRDIVFSVTGLDVSRDLPYSLFANIKLTKGKSDSVTLSKEPFKSTLLLLDAGKKLHVEMSFHGHYSEPPTSIDVIVPKGKLIKTYLLAFSLQERVWEINTQN